MPIIQRSFYDAAEKGRQDRQAYDTNLLNQQQAQQQIAQQNRLGTLMDNPNATPEQFARVGRSDVANSLLNIQREPQEQQRQFAEQMANAVKYAAQAPPGQTKQFIERNFPFLVQAYGPGWQTATEDQVHGELQGIGAKYGVQAGIPAPVPQVKWVSKPGPRGSIIQENPDTGEQKQVVGPDNSQPAPAGAGGAGEYRRFQMADKLRDEFNAQSKEFVSVGDSFNTVRAAATDPTAAGDLSLIFAYMKMLDPNSVVREQEFANAQNAAGVPDRVRNQWNKVLNGERLNPDQRKDFVSQAEKVYRIRQTRNKAVLDRYSNLAKRNGLDPNDVIGDFNVQEPSAPAQTTSAPAQIKSDAEYAALPSGAQYVAPDGSVRRKK